MKFKVIRLTLLFAILGSFYVNAQSITIKGVVMAEDDKLPLPGANVLIKNSSVGTSTDFDGNYTLQVPSGDAVVVFSYQGFKTKEVRVGTQTEINVSLDQDAAKLDEVVVIGYGSSTRKDLTGAISTINADDLTSAKVTTADEFVQGRVSGLLLTQTSGQPGAATSVRIRGSNSINASNEPLYVIDGFPVDNNSSQLSAGVSEGPALNALSSLSSSDIQSIDVLKDASATAIYGSRGSNGVIIITTKRGAEGKSQISYNTYAGISNVRKKLDLLNASQFAFYYNEALYNGSNDPRTYTDPSAWGDGTNWQDELFRTAMTISHDLSIRGGNENIRYSVSGSYLDQEGTIVTTDFKRYNLRINLDANVTKKFSIENSISLNRSDYVSARTDTPGGLQQSSAVTGAYTMSPLLPIFDPEGNYTKGDFVVQNDGTFVNDVSNNNEYVHDFVSPIAYLNMANSTGRTTRVLENLALKYKIAKNTIWKTSLGADFNLNEETLFKPEALDFGNSPGAYASKAKRVSTSLLVETTFNYVNTFREVHQLNALVGTSIQNFQIEGIGANALGLPTENFGANTFAGAVVPGVSSTLDESSLLSYFARANYIYDNRYLLTVSFRADGSSKFGTDHKFGYFPAAAFAWNASNENFMRDSNVYMKLRLGYGVTGNQEIGSYRSQSSYIPTYHVFDRTPVVGQLPRTPSNPDIRWEETAQSNIGLDLGFFNERLGITVDVYRKNTNDLLLELPVPYQTGYFSSLVNVGKVRNEGIELSLNSNNFKGDFTWDTNLTTGYNKNKITDLAGLVDIPTGSEVNGIQNWQLLVEGGEIGAFYGYVSDGIIQLDDTRADTPLFPTDQLVPGERKYKDLNGDGIIGADNDRTFLGNPIPEWTFGLNNSFTWKGFDLNVFLNGVHGNQIVNFNRVNLENLNGMSNVMLEAFANRWTPQNPSDTYTRASNAPRNAPFASNYVEDGSYLRLKSVTLGYSVKSDFLASANIDQVRVYLTGQNLYTFTNYSGVDPEVSWGGQSNALSAGADYGGYPASKTILMGLNLNF